MKKHLFIYWVIFSVVLIIFLTSFGIQMYSVNNTWNTLLGEWDLIAANPLLDYDAKLLEYESIKLRYHQNTWNFVMESLKYIGYGIFMAFSLRMLYMIWIGRMEYNQKLQTAK